jgi:hypothetical protein
MATASVISVATQAAISNTNFVFRIALSQSAIRGTAGCGHGASWVQPGTQARVRSDQAWARESAMRCRIDEAAELVNDVADVMHRQRDGPCQSGRYMRRPC